MYVIEFQKRGLPHVHLLLVLNNETKLRTSDDIDRIICAEIPDRSEKPELYTTIKSTMVHGPCGVLNRSCVCMEEWKCTKDYPEQFCEETILAFHGYPFYRRRDNGRTVLVGQQKADNRRIGPYNPYLSEKFGAHINEEACTTIKSVKYLFKYVYKGYDCANEEVKERSEVNHDEISPFLDARYVSAPDRYWRLSEFKMNDHSHSIIRLPVHLPRQQPVYFQRGKN